MFPLFKNIRKTAVLRILLSAVIFIFCFHLYRIDPEDLTILLTGPIGIFLMVTGIMDIRHRTKISVKSHRRLVAGKILFLFFTILSTGGLILYFGHFDFGGNKSEKELLSIMNQKWPDIKIYLNPESNDFFNGYFINIRKYIKVSPIGESDKSLLLNILIDELDKYPKVVLDNDLKGISLSGKLSFYDIECGGTYLGNRIYLSSINDFNGNREAYIREAFHHEFSSILLKNRNFPSAEWEATLPENFHYVESEKERVAILKEGMNLEETRADILEKGFVNDYGMLNIENDINTYAQILFTNPKKLAMLAAKYPRISPKHEIIKQFYSGLKPDHEWVFNKE